LKKLISDLPFHRSHSVVQQICHGPFPGLSLVALWANGYAKQALSKTALTCPSLAGILALIPTQQCSVWWRGCRRAVMILTLISRWGYHSQVLHVWGWCVPPLPFLSSVNVHVTVLV